MKRYYKILIFIVWSLLILKLLATPGSEFSSVFDFPFDDKLIHALLFGVFMYLFMEAVEAYFAIHFSTLSIVGLAVTFGYTSSLEYLQNFIPDRTVSIYDTLAGIIGAVIATLIIYFLDYKKIRKPKLLLHICCIACGAYVAEVLKKDYRLTLYFYNPNIFPEAEYHLRLKETRKIARKLGLKLAVGKYHHHEWLEAIRGREKDPEKGGRCIICYRKRLAAAAMLAKNLKQDYFGSTLTVSPHKVASAISLIGKELENEHGVNFLDQDFKKQDGFKKSVELSKKLCLYRQDYCGCEFSIRSD